MRSLIIMLLFSCAIVLTTVQGNVRLEDQPKTATTTVEKILKRYVRALGGKTAIQRINTRLSRGTIFTLTEIPVCAPVKIREVRPNKKATVVESACSFPVFHWGYNGKVRWFDTYTLEKPTDVIDAASSERTLPEIEEDDDVYFYPNISIQELYAGLVFKGQESKGGRQTYKIEGRRGEITRSWYFDIQTGLLRCTTLESGADDAETCYQNYKQVDGIISLSLY